MKRILTQEYPEDRAYEVSQRSQTEEENKTGESFFTRKLSDDTDSGTTLHSAPLQEQKSSHRS